MKYCFTKNFLHSQQLLFFDLIIMLTFSGRENVVFKFFCLIYLMLSEQCFNRGFLIDSNVRKKKKPLLNLENSQSKYLFL